MNTTKCLQKNLIDGAHHASKQSSYNKTLKDLFHKEERDHQVASKILMASCFHFANTMTDLHYVGN